MLLVKFGLLLQMVQARRQGRWKGKNFSLSFSEEVAKKLHFVYNVFSARTTIVSGIEHYPSSSMCCCSDDLAQLLLCSDLN